MIHRPRECPYRYRHEPHTWTSGCADAQCSGRPGFPPEPIALPSGLRLRLTEEISKILDERPEHNRIDEHEDVVNEVTDAVLSVITQDSDDAT